MNKVLILSGLVLLLMGCSPAIEKIHFQMALKGVKALSSAQVESLYTDASTYHKATNYEFNGYYGADGVKTGKSWGSWGESSDNGKWYVTNDGYLCGEWSGPWARGPRCLSVFPGEFENEYIETVVLGPRFRSNPSGVYRVRVIPGHVSSSDQNLNAVPLTRE